MFGLPVSMPPPNLSRALQPLLRASLGFCGGQEAMGSPSRSLPLFGLPVSVSPPNLIRALQPLLRASSGFCGEQEAMSSPFLSLNLHFPSLCSPQPQSCSTTLITSFFWILRWTRGHRLPAFSFSFWTPRLHVPPPKHQSCTTIDITSFF